MEFKIGRGHDSDLRINDISVSRVHAAILYKNQSFWLEDKKSKFGTLIHKLGDIPLPVNKQTTLQVGRTVLTFIARKKKTDSN